MKKVVMLTIVSFALGCSSDSSSAKSNNTNNTNNVNNANNGTNNANNANNVNNVNNLNNVSDMGSADVSADMSSADLGGVFGGSRPATVVLPSDYDAANSYPLVTSLHGYTGNSQLQAAYFGLSDVVDEKQFILIIPDGLSDNFGNQYWNATDYCCDLGGSNVDDIGYLMGLVNEAKLRYSVDEKMVYFVGHSNGGFMSYTLACEHGDAIAGIASLAGSTHLDPADCPDSGDVAILQIHGTLDATIAYNGSLNQYPGAQEIVTRWSERNGCDPVAVDGQDINITNLPQSETTVENYEGCDGYADAALWTIVGGSHIPGLNNNFAPLVIDHLFARVKP